ncbi:MAG: recombinase family protein [Ardenticatenaceae bacterium]|nr:recombinase family protein [Ardenticatenaceae bacterium]
MRYAAYVRISSDEQVGNFSVDAQQRAIDAWVLAQGGILAKTYIDEAKSGRSIDRPAFQKMRRDARKGKFDALVVHKFDRFARNRTESLAIKSLLRCDYGVKVFSVSEPSEDSDGPMGALIEGIMESVADWYSQNLGTETAKGKKERGIQGLHNNCAPFGTKKNDEKILVQDENEYPGLLLAFESYATDKYSDNDVALLLNEKGYRTKTGRPFSKDTVRDMLQNQTYLGKVKYQKYQRRSDGSRSYDAPVQWYDGQHEAFISEELFNRCMAVRAKRRSHRKATPKYNSYLLRNLVYCHHCCSNPPEGKLFRQYGKMRPQARQKNTRRYYRCRARELGYECPQKGVHVEIIDSQVVSVLMSLKPPKNWRKNITSTMSQILGEKDLAESINEIKAKIKRMDMRWDNGFISSEQEYMKKRIELQHELEQLTPVGDDELEKTANILENFAEHWEKLEGDEERQHELVKLIVDRVYVEDETVVAMTLKSNYHLVLGHNAKEPTSYEVDPYLVQVRERRESLTHVYNFDFLANKYCSKILDVNTSTALNPIT